MTSAPDSTALVNVSIFHPSPSTKNFSDTSPTTLMVSSNHSLDLSTDAAGSVNGTTEHVKVSGTILSSHAAAIAVFVGVIVVAILVVIVFIYLRRRRNLSYLPFPCDKCCMQGRKRRSSTTSFNNPLTATDDDLVVPRDRELFSIGDQDGGQDGRDRSRARVETEDDYFYDEIFERSAFVDERTNKSNKQLTVEDFDDDFDIPNLTFKPPTTFKMA